MKRSAVFLQAIVVLIGVVALALLLWEPHLEGRNAHATFFEIYFKDPFLAFAYVASVPFFVALFQAFNLLGYAGEGKVFSSAAVRPLRIIRTCATASVLFAAAGIAFIMLAPSDDRAGGVAIGILIAFGASVVAAAAGMLERMVQAGVDLKAGPSMEGRGDGT